MLEICVPKSRIECVSVESGKYHVRYFSGRRIVYEQPPKSVTDFIAKTPTKEHMTIKYKDDRYEYDLYRNYRMKGE